MIFAWNNADPVTGNGDWRYHGSSQRFSRVAMLLDFKNESLNEQFKPLVPSETYTHSLIVDEDEPEQYQFYWKLINKDEIQFEVHTKTTGWVGMGLSPDGGMTGSLYIYMYFFFQLFIF